MTCNFGEIKHRYLWEIVTVKSAYDYSFLQVYCNVGIWKKVYYRDNKIFLYLHSEHLEVCWYDSDDSSIFIKDIVFL